MLSVIYVLDGGQVRDVHIIRRADIYGIGLF